jgi:NADPH2:quinone reductase
MAKQRGAHVLATASTAKLQIARELGADVVIDYTRDDVAAAVRDATGGRGVDVAYDSVGLTTRSGSMMDSPASTKVPVTPPSSPPAAAGTALFVPPAPR